MFPFSPSPPSIPFSQSIKVKYPKFFPTCPKPISSSIWDRKNMVHLFIYSFIHLTDFLESSQAGPLSTGNKATNNIYVAHGDPRYHPALVEFCYNKKES